MRFTEIANPEDQLALWKLVSDKMWAAFAEPVIQTARAQVPQISTSKATAINSTRTASKTIPQTSHKASAKSKLKAIKPKIAPMAQSPKPFPKPTPQQLTPTQIAKQQSQQHQQLAKHLHKELIKPRNQQRPDLQPPPLGFGPTASNEPLNNSLDDRDKDELIMHSRSQHPFKTISQIKSAPTGRNRGF